MVCVCVSGVGGGGGRLSQTRRNEYNAQRRGKEAAMVCACLCGINGKFLARQSMSYPLYVRMEGSGGAGLVGVIYISASHCPPPPPHLMVL